MRWAVMLACASLLVGVFGPREGATASAPKSGTIWLLSAYSSKSPTHEPNPGDVFSVKSTLHSRPQFGRPGAMVGSDIRTVTVLSRWKLDVKVTAKLPGGTLRAAGRIARESRRLPVLGGTGVFAGARGVLDTWLPCLHPCFGDDMSLFGPPIEAPVNRYRLQLP
jgi:hypothetical protein